VPPLVLVGPRGEEGIAFGDQTVNGSDRPGFRLAVGGWLNPCKTWGFEADYYDLGEKTTRFHTGTSGGDPEISRPIFIDSFDNPERYDIASLESLVVEGTLPGFPTGGSVSVEASDYFQSAGVRLRRNLFNCSWQGKNCVASGFHIDATAGYRYFRLLDRVGIRSSQVVYPSESAAFGPGTIIDISDSFNASNRFHGAELGVVSRFNRGRWGLEFRTAAALGGTHELLSIGGSTTVTQEGLVPATDPQGLLTVNGVNIGTHVRDELTVIPEIGAEVSYQPTCHLRLYAGYNLVYWTDVLRAGDQIDLRINQFSSLTEFSLHQSDFWAQGVRVGGELRF
jgi:hypothetical protein